MVEDLTTHPTREQLAAFVQGQLNHTDQQAVETHVELCKSCSNLLHDISHDDSEKQHPSTSPTVQLTNRTGKNETSQSEIEKADTGNLDIPENLVNHPRYEIVNRLGVGGMGVVYQAQHRLMGRMVALKVITNRLLQNSQMVERFRLEIKAAARLSHRNIVTAFDAEQAGDIHFFVMEFVEGTDLSSIVSRRGELPVTHACNYILQAARGLQHAHEQGMVHRDIKPQNLMCTPKGVIKVLDFGLARLAGPQDEENSLTGLTAEGITLGTPDYIAPEQARDSRQADIRSDIYSLGCTFYYLLTGKVPFPTGTIMEKVIAHCESTPKPIKKLRDDLPDAIVNIIETMMAKKPSERFQTPQDVVNALKPFASKQKNSELQTEAIEQPTEMPDAAKPIQPLHDPNTFPKIKEQTLHQQQTQDTSGWLARYRKLTMAALLGAIAIVTFAIVYSQSNHVENRQTNGNQTNDRQQTETAWVDLTQQINLAEHALAGEWQQNEEGLHVEAQEWARLILPYAPPAEYDLEVQFTRLEGTQSIAIFFVQGTGQASFELDAWNNHLVGIQRINNQDMRSNPTRLANRPLQNNQIYTALIRVRRGRVETFLNDEQLHTHEGDGSDLTLSPNWSLGSTTALGIGAYNSQTTFHRIRLRPVR